MSAPNHATPQRERKPSSADPVPPAGGVAPPGTRVAAPAGETTEGARADADLRGDRDTRRRPGRKPTLTQLGVDPAGLQWQRSGAGEGSFEVAFLGGEPPRQTSAGANWVLLRVAGDPDNRVLIYDRTEWICFLDGVSRGEFG